MIIWQGYGFLSLVVPIICACIAASIVPNSDKFALIGGIIGAVLVYILGTYLHNPDTNETVLYDNSGKPYVYCKHIDTLYWIKMEYIAVIIGVLCVIALFI